MHTAPEPPECLDFRDDGSCQGSVEYHSTDPGRRPAFPRCDAHWHQALEREEQTRSRYGTDSSVPPSDFDPTYAGERWDEEY